MSAEPNRKKAYSADDPSILQNSPKFKYSCQYSSSDLSYVSANGRGRSCGKAREE